MSAPPTVELIDIHKRFGPGREVLQGLNLRLDAGGFASVVGESGCGKTTLLRLVAGLEVPDSGTARVAGQAPGASSAGVAFVFQDPTLLPWLSLADNVELPLLLRGTDAATRAMLRREVLELVRLGSRSGAYPRELSGGERMRASLARALTLSPGLLLLDEPFAAIDEMNRERLAEELLAIRALKGWSALLVTHSVHEAVFLSNRVLVMSGRPGCITADIPVPLTYPRTAETRMHPEYQETVATVSRHLRSGSMAE